VEVLLKEMFENIHEVRSGSRLGIHHQDNTEEQRQS
jgi:3'-phosphoadenosine 5'-phosphosulfate sulfotransferase